jgi:hypothetical protein
MLLIRIAFPLKVTLQLFAMRISARILLFLSHRKSSIVEN